MTSLVWDNVQPSGAATPKVEGPVLEYYEGFIYLAAGQATSSTTNKYPNGFFRFSLATSAWQDISQPSNTYYSRFYTNSCVYGGYFYLIYGWSNDNLGNDVPDIMRVDLNSTDFLWHPWETSVSFYRDSYAIAIKNSQVYLCGGFSGASNSNLNDLILLHLDSATMASLTPNGEFPLSRIGPSMHLINGNFYLFGGQGLGSYYNDMWQYDIDAGIWKAISQYGDIPEARSRHAYSTQGDALVIWGGEGASGMLQDLHIYNTLTNYWTTLVSESTSTPGAAIGACMIMDMPFLYIFGGLSYLGCLGELWLYSMAENSYTMLDNNGPQEAYTYCQMVGDALYVMSGESDGQKPSDAVNYYNITAMKWVTTSYVESDNPAAQSLQVMIGTSIIKIAGEAWDIDPINLVLVQNPGQILEVGSIVEFVYLSGYVYYNTSLYSFGGGSIIGQSLRLSVPSNSFIQIDLADICISGVCTVECSPGTLSTPPICTKSGLGYYSEGFGNTKAEACPAGTSSSVLGATSSRQCYPCADGTYNAYNGSSLCLQCPTGYSCPIGSSEPAYVSINTLYNSIQPDLYRASDTSAATFQYEITIGMFMLLVILVCIASKRLRSRLDLLDLYPALHNHIVKTVMMLDNTILGGFFSLIFITLAMIIVGASIISYQLDNIEETKALVPLVILESEVTEFVAKNVQIYASFLRYGDSCVNSTGGCSDLIFVNFYHVNYNSTAYTCALLDKTCTITVTCTACVFDAGSMLSIVLTEKLSYATGIYVNVSSTSSIPDKTSSVLNDLYPNTGYMFIGSMPSEFYFLMTPSLFESQSSLWPAKDTGYHVSMEYSSVAGSQYISLDLPITSQLQLNIYLDKSTDGLFTARVVKQSLIFVLSSLLGSVFGIMGAVGAAMKFIEGQLLKRRNKVGKGKMLRKLQGKRKEIKDCVSEKEMCEDEDGNVISKDCLESQESHRMSSEKMDGIRLSDLDRY